LTMQIGIIGSDGIVLASDTQWTNVLQTTVNGEREATRTYRYSSKTKSNDQIVVSYAADQKTAQGTAQTILQTFADNDPQGVIEQIARNIPVGERRDVQGLIAIPPERLLRFDIGMQDGLWTPSCEESFRYDFAGDMANTSKYWIYRYYDDLLTVEQLIPLAAYAILCSHVMNTAGIGGLEIVTCTASKITHVPRERLLDLQRMAKKLDEHIFESIIGNAQN